MPSEGSLSSEIPRTRADAALLQLRLWPDPVLEQECEPVEPGQDLTFLLERMRAVMDAAGGAGLAAPQLGVLVQVFIIAERVPASRHVFINPKKPLLLGRRESMTEGCLSVPGVLEPISRGVRARVIHEQGTDFLQGLGAHVAQHEYEHLLGKIQVARRQR